MEILIVIAVVLITFLSRFINLTGIPIFTDEAIYIRWAQIGLHDPAHRYISLTDGKQPLMTWLMYPFLMLFKDPLWAGRIVSVCAAVFSVVGIYLVTRTLFGKKTALFSCLLYIISPFFMVYDRLALMDSLLASFSIWSLYISVLFVRKIRLDIALILGMVIGGGLLTKSSAQFFIFSLPLSLILFRMNVKNKMKLFFKWLGLSLLLIIIAEVMYNSLRLSPWFYIINQKNLTFIYSFKEFFQDPFAVFLPNLNGMTQMLVGYLTIPITILVCLGIIHGMLRKDKTIVYLTLMFLFPFLALVTFGKVIFPRFMLFMIPPLLLIASDALSRFTYFSMKKMPVFLLVTVLIVVYPAYQSILLMVKPIEAAIPQVDRNQLFDDWPSGMGVKEVISYLKHEALNRKIVIGTEGTFGLNPAVYEMYLGLDKNVEIHGYWPVSTVPQELLDKAKVYPTYLIFKEKQDVPAFWPLELIAKYKRGKGNTYLLFYKVLP
jgi:4-amino-4-deoxy-L-arabinose transferase-like glycosyltransferase